MEKWKFCGLIAALVCFLIFAPVSACHVATLTKTGPEVACPTCEYYEYTITAQASNDAAVNYLTVEDTLPAGLTYVSATPLPTSVVGQKLTWVFTPGKTLQTITVRVAPSGSLTSISNTVKAFVSYSCYPVRGGSSCQISDKFATGASAIASSTTTFSADVCPHEAPEFPSTMLPATMIIGFLGVVLFIQRTRE
jgi:uncharacterized repeat protein (TIGR01451 family)